MTDVLRAPSSSGLDRVWVYGGVGVGRDRQDTDPVPEGPSLMDGCFSGPPFQSWVAPTPNLSFVCLTPRIVTSHVSSAKLIPF